MLVLTRRVGERICIGDDIVITIVQLGQGKVRVGVDAPSSALVLREELVERKSPVAASPAAAMPLMLDLPTSPASESCG